MFNLYSCEINENVLLNLVAISASNNKVTFTYENHIAIYVIDYFLSLGRYNIRVNNNTENDLTDIIITF